MPRRSPRHAAPPSLKLPLALAVAALVVLGFGRWWLARPAPPASPVLDEGSYVTAIAPMLRRAGCASPSCHAAAAAPHLDPSPTSAAAALAELAAVRPFVGPGTRAASPFWSRATSRAHAGAGALAPDACEAATLSRWIAGAVVRACPLPSPAPRPPNPAP